MSTPPLSSTPTPLPLSPAESPTSIAHTPATIAFQSTLPQLLQPLSPELSALYTARIRLLLELPVGSSRGWCCTKCGWLKDEFGWKVVKVKEERASKAVRKTADVPIAKKGKGRGRKTKAEGELHPDISVPDEPSPLSHSDSPNHPWTPSSSLPVSSQPSAAIPKIGIGARIPCSKPASRNRQKSTCPLCGSAISLRAPSASTKAEFMSTRKTRAIVEANGGDVSVLPMANGISGDVADDGNSGRTRSKRTRASSKQESEMAGTGRTEEATVFESTGIALIAPPAYDPLSRSSTASGKPLIPDPIKASPKLAYIAITDPEPATESLPSLIPSALPPPGEDRPAGTRNAVGFVNLGPVGGTTGRAASGKGGKKQSNLKTSTVSSQLTSATSATATTKASVKPTVVKPTTVKPTAAAVAPPRGPPPKKKQKTGLAKLLADSKAREQESEKKKGTGLLSLDGADWEL